MIELLAGALIGDMTSAESLAFDDGVGATPCHGELLLAFDPQRFLGDDFEQSQQRAEQLFAAITDQGARLPSQRRFAARQRSKREGVWLSRSLVQDIKDLLA
jgi:LDH2 family malate/lactate/ureidoglycolate dehydrogenase